MKTLKIIGIVAGILVLGVIALMISAPASNHVESSIIINAPTATIYREANSFKNFTTWSPFKDPEAKYTYEGPESGIGAKMTWEGPEIGKGQQEIIENAENRYVKNRLSFDGFPGSYVSEMTLEPVDGGTKVTWTYDSDYSEADGMSGSMGKVIEMLMGDMIQEQYAEGLKSLKRVVESSPEN